MVKRNPSIKQELLIRYLNPLISGWVNYHKHNVSGKAFERVDYDIWKCLWQWALRRHKNKGRKWIAKRYFHMVGTRSWTFSVPTKQKIENGEPVYIRLKYASDTNIRRFTKIKSEANPFDTNWNRYFEERETDKMKVSLKGRHIMKNLFYNQSGNCAHCGKKLTVDSGCMVHEVKSEGRTYKLMVHPYCHKELHSLETELSRFSQESL